MKSLCGGPGRTPAIMILALIGAFGCARNTATRNGGEITGSADSDAVTQKLGDTVEIRRGERVGFGGSVRLTFERVPEDSRCPEDVTCVWAGNARVELTLRKPDGTDARFVLNTGIAPRDTLLDGLRARLHGLTPVPNSKKPIEPDAYVARVSVTQE